MCFLSEYFIIIMVKPQVLEQNDTAYKLATLDVSKKDNRLLPETINIGNAAKQKLATSKVSDLDKLNYYNDCVELLTALVSKIQERSPLKYSLVRSLCCLDPKLIYKDSMACIGKFSDMCKKLVASKVRTARQCDMAERQFRNLLRNERELFKDGNTRLDLNITSSSWKIKRKQLRRERLTRH